MLIVSKEYDVDVYINWSIRCIIYWANIISPYFMGHNMIIGLTNLHQLISSSDINITKLSSFFTGNVHVHCNFLISWFSFLDQRVSVKGSTSLNYVPKVHGVY